MEKNIHPFQLTLGLGPYRLVGFFALQLPSEANQGRNNFHLAPPMERGLGTCAHCGHGIVNIYIVQIADGKRFGVGSDCIHKAGLPYTELTKLQKHEREQARIKRQEIKIKKGNLARASIGDLISEHADIMRSKPHPKKKPSASLLDYAQWVLKNSNDGGVIFALKTIKKELKTP